MSRSFFTMRLRAVRCDLNFESLERRQVMSGTDASATVLPQAGDAAETSTLSLAAVGIHPLDRISVSPGDGQVFSADSAPQQIVVSIKDARLFKFAAGSWQNKSVLLFGIGSNGEAVLLEDLSKKPTVHLDSEAQTATFPLENPLAPGRYRIVLAGDEGSLSQLLYTNGTGITGDDGSWNYMEDQTLVDFQVIGKSVSLGDAVNIGAVGPNIMTVPGYLDLRAGGVALYKITLGTSQPLWRLGLQLDAERIGSALRGALTLFDQQGRALASRSASEGLGTLVDDPYLFAALKPGVYYVGVSGVGNLGGQPGGYDPTTGEPGVSSTAQAGGPFHLEIVADPVTAMKVVGFSLQWGDSTKSPIGFTVSFSDAIDPDSLMGDPLYIQDSQGKRFPLVFGSLGSKLNQVQYLFSQLLAPGDYSLIVPEKGGLTDLIGRSPVATGFPSGTLATWTVQATNTPPSSGDAAIPVTFSRTNDQDLVAYGTAVIAGGGDVTYRLVVPPLVGSLLETAVSNGNIRVQWKGGEGEVAVEGVQIEPTKNYPYSYQYRLELRQGVYYLTLSAVGPEPMSVDWKLTIKTMDSPISNAVGSAGALSLRTVGPIGSEAPAPFSAVARPVSISALPSSFTVTVGSALAGRPSAQNDALSVVGPNVPGGLLALADSRRGLIAGILPAGGFGDDGLARSPDGSLVKKVASEQPSKRTERAPSDDEVRLADGEERGVQADASALLEADRLAEAVRSVGPWLFRGVEDGLEAVANGNWLDSLALARAEGGSGDPNEATRGDVEHTGQVERASLGVPITLVVAAAAAFRFRQLALKWWRRSPSNAKPTKSTQSPLWRGPRFMVPPDRRPCRSRTSHRV